MIINKHSREVERTQHTDRACDGRFGKPPWPRKVQAADVRSFFGPHCTPDNYTGQDTTAD